MNDENLDQNKSTPTPGSVPDLAPPTTQTQPVAMATSSADMTEQQSGPDPGVVSSTTHPEESPKKEKSGALSFFVTILIALALTQIINMFFFQSYRVFGSSMHPTMEDGDRLIINKTGKTFSNVTNKKFEPKRGEIIVFTSPKEPDMQLIKRVIGLPGERVVVKGGHITVYNNQHPGGFNVDADTEWGPNLPTTTGEADVVVPEGHIFVSGDNRIGSNSLDSRNELGTVPEENIVGTTSLRLWPLQSARFF